MHSNINGMLKQCPACRKHYLKSPSCGKSDYETGRISAKRLAKVVITAALIFSGIALATLFFDPAAQEGRDAAKEAETIMGVINDDPGIACLEIWKDELLDPTSPILSSQEIIVSDDGLAYIQIVLRAKNAYGAYIPAIAACTVSGIDDPVVREIDRKLSKIYFDLKSL